MHIVIEGQDATGKDTQAKLLVEYLEKQGKRVVTYSESGTGSPDPFVTKIAKLNYGSKQDIDHRTRVLLYLINRYEQWRKIAEPALLAGDIVITTRNWISTLVYEGFGGGVSRSLITKLHKTVMPEKYFHPDKMVVFTISPETQAKRLGIQPNSENSDWDRKDEVWKSKGLSFQEKLNAGYLQVIKEFKLPTLSAEGTIEEIHQDLLKLFEL